MPEPRCIGFDGPQGLPKQGENVRSADREANTPTKKLPKNRAEMQRWPIYRGLIEAGVELFWTIHERKYANIPGLPSAKNSGLTVFETYPRYIIRRLWPDLKPIPPKTKKPVTYVSRILNLIKELGYRTPTNQMPEVDHVDAMLCAIAAEALNDSEELPGGTVGQKPIIDKKEKVLREGYIISP